MVYVIFMRLLDGVCDLDDFGFSLIESFELWKPFSVIPVSFWQTMIKN